MSETFPVEFDYVIDGLAQPVRLSAKVSIEATENTYLVSHISSQNHSDLIPDIRIKKLHERWVHVDSEKETHLSTMVGQAIVKKLVY